VGVAIIGLVLVGLVVLVAIALFLAFHDDGLPEDAVDHADLGLPDRLLTADDVAGLRFRTGLRGYRMDDVDAALDRLAQSLRAAQERAER
jgi:DivIVA domain-containing protein